MSSPSGLQRIAAVLRAPNYGVYTAGNSVSLIGTWMQRVAVGWLTWELTGSAAWLGIVAFADLFPTVVIAPLAGAAADRWDRLRILRATETAAAIQAVCLFALNASGRMSVTALFIATLCLGVTIGIGQPSRLALIPSLVRRDDLATAVAVNSVVFNLARFIGPALAGLFIAGGEISLAFAANALTYLAFLFALSRLRLDPGKRTPAGRRGGLGADLVEGLLYAVRHPGIGPLLGLLIATNVCGRPFVELLPGFAAGVFAVGPQGLAWMMSAIGLGAIGGGAWLAGRSEERGLVAITLASTLMLALLIGLFVATDRIELALPILAASGVAMVGAGVGSHTLLQLAVASAMRGRVLALYGLIFRGGPALGALLMGAIAERTGLVWPIAIGAGVLAAAAMAVAARYAVMTAALDIRGGGVKGNDGTQN